MPSETVNPEKALADVRKEIDAIDDAIQDLLIKRTGLVVEVAEAKARAASRAGQGSFIAFRPDREAQVLRRLAQRQKGKLSLTVVFRLWREVIAAMTRIQGPFRVDIFGGTNKLGFWDLARSYYGSSTPMELHGNARDVLARVAHDRSAIGILPAPGEALGSDWWTELLAGGARIVALLPFLDIAGEPANGAPRAVVVAQAKLETTGDDTGLIALAAAPGLSDTVVEGKVKDAGFEGMPIASVRGGDGIVLTLFAVSGHVADDDKRLDALRANGAGEAARVIGGYANPVRRDRDTG